MAAAQQPLEAPAESTGARVPDVAALLKQIKEHQEAYEVLYSRNVLLHTELTEAKQVVLAVSCPRLSRL